MEKGVFQSDFMGDEIFAGDSRAKFVENALDENICDLV